MITLLILFPLTASVSGSVIGSRPPRPVVSAGAGVFFCSSCCARRSVAASVLLFFLFFFADFLEEPFTVLAFIVVFFFVVFFEEDFFFVLLRPDEADVVLGSLLPAESDVPEFPFPLFLCTVLILLLQDQMLRSLHHLLMRRRLVQAALRYHYKHYEVYCTLR